MRVAFLSNVVAKDLPEDLISVGPRVQVVEGLDDIEETYFWVCKNVFGNEKGIQTFSAPSLLARLILTPNFLHLLLRILSNRKILDHNITVWLLLTIQEIISILFMASGMVTS